MTIVLDKITESGEVFEYQFSFDLNETKFNITDSKAEIYPNGNLYNLDLTINVTITDVCDRCLTKFNETIESKLNLMISTEEDKNKNKEEIELTDEETSLYIAIDGIINLQDIIMQETIMLRTQKRLCSNDCLGICTTCGVNLNTEKCVCDEQTDVRWQALKKYITKQNQEI